MNAERLTEKSMLALHSAARRCAEYENPTVSEEHLLLALLQDEGGLAVTLLSRCGAPIPEARERLEAILRELPKGKGGEPTLSRALDATLSHAEKIMSNRKDEYLSVEHIIAVAFDPVYGARPLKRYIRSELKTLLARTVLSEDLAPDTHIRVEYRDGALVALFDVE